MDSNTLVAELIRDGQTLLDRLAARGYVVTAAGWVRKPDAGWLLYIATPEGEARGWYAARYDVHEQIRTPPTLLIYPLDVRLVSPTDRITEGLRMYTRIAPGGWLYGDWNFAGYETGGAYIYPVSGSPATQPA